MVKTSRVVNVYYKDFNIAENESKEVLGGLKLPHVSYAIRVFLTQ